MSLFKIEDVLAENRHLTRADILRMPFYEFMLKLEIMKQRAEERDKKERAEQDKQSRSLNPSNYKAPTTKMPKMPKMPTKFR
jgi:hypothetical protein